MDDYDYDTDDDGDYSDYVYPYELTDEEILDWCIKDVASGDDRGALLQRQKEIWDVFGDKVEKRFYQLIKDFDNHTGYRATQWWDLVSVHQINALECMLPDWELETSSHREIDDINAYGYGAPMLTMVRSHQIYLDFVASSIEAREWMHAEASRHQGLIIPKGGWYWQLEPYKLRMPIQMTMVFTESNIRVVKFSVQSTHCPPVAGRLACWLPSMRGYNEGAIL